MPQFVGGLTAIDSVFVIYTRGLIGKKRELLQKKHGKNKK